METNNRIQTAFRLDAGLLERLKWKARRIHQSLNSYVEDVLERDAGRELTYPRLSLSSLEKGKELAGQYVLKDCGLPGEYEGLDAYGQAEMDEQVLYREKYEDNDV